MKHPEPSGGVDGVTGFLKHLAVQGGQGRFPRVDAASWQLQFWPRPFLKCRKNPVPRIYDDIGPGPWRVAARCIRPFPEASVHAVPPVSAHASHVVLHASPPLAKRNCFGYGTDMTDDHIAAIRATAERVLRLEASAVTQMANALPSDFELVVERILNTEGRVILSGIGKSGHIARKISSTFASTGTPSTFVHPAEASHGDLGMVMPGDLAILISNSGETAELKDLVAHVARFQIPLVGVSGRMDSTLMQAAEFRLLLPDAPEACVIGMAPTTSTTLTLALGDALCVAVMERRGFQPDQFHTFHPGGKLGARLATVAQLMHGPDELPLVTSTQPMSDTLIVMSEKGFGIAGVMEGDTLFGVISDGDLRRNMATLMDHAAGDVATKSPRVVGPSDLAAEALATMSEQRITALFVVDDSARPIGLLHLHDCLRAGLV